MGIPHFIHPFFHWWTWGCFHFLPIINDPTVNVHYQVFVCTFAHSLRCTARDGIVGWSRNYFNLSKNYHTVFQSNCFTSCPIPKHCHQRLLFSGTLLLATLWLWMILPWWVLTLLSTCICAYMFLLPKKLLI